MHHPSDRIAHTTAFVTPVVPFPFSALASQGRLLVEFGRRGHEPNPVCVVCQTDLGEGRHSQWRSPAQALGGALRQVRIFNTQNVLIYKPKF